MSMNHEQREAVLRDAQAELAEAREELNVIQRKVQYLQQVVDGLSGLLEPIKEERPKTTPRPTEPEPVEAVVDQSTDGAELISDSTPPLKPRDAIIQVMSAVPNLPMSARQIVELVRDRGLFDNALKSGTNGYTTALRRLADDPASPVAKDASGLYVYRSTYAAGGTP